MIYTFLIALILCTGLTTDSLQLNVWEVYEITLEIREKYGNAYQKVEATKGDDLVKAVFKGITAEIGAINAYNRRNIFFLDPNTLERVDQAPLLPYFSLKTRIN